RARESADDTRTRNAWLPASAEGLRTGASALDRIHARQLEIDLVADEISIPIDEKPRRVAELVVVTHADVGTALEAGSDEIEQLIDRPIPLEIARFCLHVVIEAVRLVAHVDDRAALHRHVGLWRCLGMALAELLVRVDVAMQIGGAPALAVRVESLEAVGFR